MVHALEEIHRLLRPGGVLIDIHPHQEGAFVTASIGGDEIFCERERKDDSEDVMAAERALAEALRRGLFTQDRSEEFEFLTHADTASELRACWEEIMAFDPEPQEAAELAYEEEVYARLELAAREAGVGVSVAMRERCHMARLRPAQRSMA